MPVYLEQFAYLLEQAAPDAAQRFLDAVDRASARIQEMPGVGGPKDLPNSRLRGLRSWPVPGFEAVRIYYLETEDTIRVVRVLHGRRDVGRLLENEEG